MRALTWAPADSARSILSAIRSNDRRNAPDPASIVYLRHAVERYLKLGDTVSPHQVGKCVEFHSVRDGPHGGTSAAGLLDDVAHNRPRRGGERFTTEQADSTQWAPSVLCQVILGQQRQLSSQRTRLGEPVDHPKGIIDLRVVHRRRVYAPAGVHIVGLKTVGTAKITGVGGYEDKARLAGGEIRLMNSGRNLDHEFAFLLRRQVGQVSTTFEVFFRLITR
jgi:hypothetical protein